MSFEPRQSVVKGQGRDTRAEQLQGQGQLRHARGRGKGKARQHLRFLYVNLVPNEATYGVVLLLLLLQLMNYADSFSDSKKGKTQHCCDSEIFVSSSAVVLF